MPIEERNNDEYSSTNTHTRFNDDNDERDNERTDNSYSGTIISPKDYNSIKQCTDLSRRNILNPTIGAPVWMAVRKYIFMQWILFKVNDINVKHAREYHPKIDLQIICNRGGLTGFNGDAFTTRQAWEISSAILDRVIPNGPVMRILQSIKWPTPIAMFIQFMDQNSTPKPDKSCIDSSVSMTPWCAI